MGKYDGIKKEVIEKYYIEQNLSKDEVCSILGMSGTSFVRVCKKLGIKKDPKLTAKMISIHNMEKYGVKNTSALPEVRAKIEKTTMERYGVRVSSQAASVKEKQEKTNFERYGKKSALQNDCVKEKKKETMISKYGTEIPLRNPEIMQKTKETNQEKYGADFAFCTEEAVEKNARAKANYSKETGDILYDKEKCRAFLESDPGQTIEYYCKKLGCSSSSIRKKVLKYGLGDLIGIRLHSSSYETEILDLLSSWGVEAQHDVRGLLPNNQEIDIYVPSRRVGIEFNGTYWHSDLYKQKNYHYAKTLAAEAAGIRLIHIYEYEWQDPTLKGKITELLRIALGRPSRVIYARQCKVREITNAEAAPLNDAVHLQGHRNAQVTYGLYYKDELVQLMSFSQTKYNRNLKGDGEWEIIRGCPGSNNIVVGGVSRLFARFVRDHSPKKVFSYCDLNKFNGASYEALGMKSVGDTGPNKTWIIDGKGVPRNPHRYKEYKELAEAIMWGAGSRKYVWWPEGQSAPKEEPTE